MGAERVLIKRLRAGPKGWGAVLGYRDSNAFLLVNELVIQAHRRKSK